MLFFSKDLLAKGIKVVKLKNFTHSISQRDILKGIFISIESPPICTPVETGAGLLHNYSIKPQKVK